MRSLKWKLVLIYFLLVLIVMVVSGTFIIVFMKNMEIQGINQQLKENTDLVADQVLTSQNQDKFSETLIQLTRGSMKNSDMETSILNSMGITIATNATVTGSVLPQYNNTAVISAIDGTEKYGRGKWADATGIIKEWQNYARPVTIGNTSYIIYTQADISSVSAKTGSTTNIIILASLIALLISIVVGILFASTITSPIVALTKKAKDMARGRLNVSVLVKSEDEIGQLTKSFNHMARELNLRMSEISSEKNKLETLLNNMTDGVLAFNQYGEVIHANDASHLMLGSPNAVLAVEDMIEIFGLQENFDELMQSGDSFQVAANIQHRHINASFAPYTDISGKFEGIVVVLQDATEQKMLEDMRKEFVANVSHEIRTPLTTIKSYAETLIDGAINNRELALDFLGTIDGEADRMGFLVSDLLQLSSIDNKKLVMKIEEIDIRLLVENNVKHCKVLAENKNQRILYSSPPKEIIIQTDIGRATQVLTNILSNAIKYSSANREIEIRIKETQSLVGVSIKDWGMGIPKEDLPRIFERFYRVDKARSRQMGGTGLGLAIAKEIMLQLGGKIEAESDFGVGTTMTVYFPKNT